MQVAFLGDVHGKWWLIPQHLPYPVIQVGDLGIGFKIHIIGKGVQPDPESFGPDFHFIRGNHDNPQECAARSEYLGDFGVSNVLNELFYVGGGFSIDRGVRTEGLDWWPDEELTIAQLNAMLDLYEKTKPSVVVTHEAPASIVKHSGLFNHIYDYRPSRTAQALDSMFEIHKPDRWIFGHHHRHVGKEILGTRFVCLDEGEVYHVEI